VEVGEGVVIGKMAKRAHLWRFAKPWRCAPTIQDGLENRSGEVGLESPGYGEKIVADSG
jgi:hypothetical protein